MIVTQTYPRTSTDRVRGSVFGRVSEALLGDREIKDIIAKFGPDVIYSDSPLYGAHIKYAQLGLKKRIPTIIHLRGDLWREFFGWMQRSSIKARLFGSPTYFESFLGLALANRVTPICKWLAGEVLRHFPSKAIDVVYQGVDPSDFYSSPGLDLARPAVSIIQNHTVYEKTLGLLRFARVVEKLPDVHFYITSGEDVKQRYLPVVKATFSRFKNVYFLDGIGHPGGVRRLLTASDLYVLPSYLDCCPTTVLEASLMEKPVLGSRVGGIPEIIYDGYTGWSIPNENTAQWVDRIRVLLQDGKLSRRLGSQGRRWVSQNFGWATIASQVEQLILHHANSLR